MTVSRLTGGVLLGIAALVVFYVVRQETRMAQLEERRAEAGPPARAEPAARRAPAVRVGKTTSVIAINPAGTRALAKIVNQKALHLDAAGEERLARYLFVAFAQKKRDELRAGMKLHENTAAAAALDLEAELAKVGLTPAQREKLHRTLPALARTLPDRR